MARTVLLSVEDGEWNVWGNRFVKRQPLQRVQQTIKPAASSDAAAAAVVSAARTAGAQGVLIISVGHGTQNKPGFDQGTFQLAPNRSMTIAGGVVPGRFVNVFYATRSRPDQPSDMENDIKNNPRSQFLANFRAYQKFSAEIKAVGLQRIVLLTCNVGIAEEFMRKVANDWGCVIQGYRRRIGIQKIVGTGRFANDEPIRVVFFDGEAANFNSPAELLVFQEEEIPFDRNLIFLVGPPLRGGA